jgi:vacuolar protein sorting-associated protein 13A/C
LHLTQTQYQLIIQLSQAIPRVVAGVPNEISEMNYPVSTEASTSPTEEPKLVDLEPELASTDGSRIRPTLDLIVSVKAIKLQLYDAAVFGDQSLKDHGIARFALNDNTLRLKILSDGAMEAQVVLRSLTMNNTRPGKTKFREMIPAAQHERNQFMVLYTMSGGISGSSLAVLTVDSPKIIFAIDPLIALLGFFTNSDASRPVPEEYIMKNEQRSIPDRKMDFRIDLHDLSVSVLENDADPESHSIQLAVEQILLSQQVCFVNIFTVHRMGPNGFIGHYGPHCQPTGHVTNANGKTFRKCSIFG